LSDPPRGEDRALIERFLEMLGAEAGASANTLAAYGTDLRLASEVLDGALGTADEAGIARLAAAWQPLSSATVARKAAALRRFFAFLAEEGFRADDPGGLLPRPGTVRALPRVLTTGDVDALFAVIAARIALRGRRGCPPIRSTSGWRR
jgi:integrase/recombinase XerD